MTKAGFPLPPRPSSSAVTASNSPANERQPLQGEDGDAPKKKRRRQSAPAGSVVPPTPKSVGKRNVPLPMSATATAQGGAGTRGKKRESRGGLEEQVIEE